MSSPRHGNYRDALEPDQVESGAPHPKIVEGCYGSALARFCQVANGGDEVAHRALKIGLKVAAADDAFLGVEVDQDERPAIEQADFGDDRTLQRDGDGSEPDALQCQAGDGHRSVSPTRR
jgi:hypothetical protein